MSEPLQLVPRPDYAIQLGDNLIVMGSAEALRETCERPRSSPPDRWRLSRWLPGTALVICDTYDHHGHHLVPHAPRSILHGQIARLPGAAGQHDPLPQLPPESAQ